MNGLEAAVTRLWRALPFAGHTACHRCGEPAYCRGWNPRLRVCLGCFDAADCRAPRRA